MCHAQVVVSCTRGGLHRATINPTGHVECRPCRRRRADGTASVWPPSPPPPLSPPLPSPRRLPGRHPRRPCRHAHRPQPRPPLVGLAATRHPIHRHTHRRYFRFLLCLLMFAEPRVPCLGCVRVRLEGMWAGLFAMSEPTSHLALTLAPVCVHGESNYS